MNSITVKAEREYEVLFVDDYASILVRLVDENDAVIIYPEILSKYVAVLPESWHRICVPDGEAQKNSATFVDSLNRIAAKALGKSTKIIGLGGGATTDLAGFLAASYLRGVEWIAVPTSLAGMVDASVGGKTGINLESGKNLAGAFHSPIAVVVDESFLKTIEERDLSAGMAEVVKCGFIADGEILKLIEEGWRDNLSKLIQRAINVKAQVVSEDFRESYAREILNYGHTLGHAIEKHSSYQMRHGECVSIGMVFAAELSRKVSGLSEDAVNLHRDLLQALNLPITYKKEAWPELFELMQSDKKKGSKGLRFVTLMDLGKTTRAEEIPLEVLEDIYLSKVGE
jgi:3-dehydroquinate synthase